MYKRHRIISYILVITALASGIIFDLQYSKIAEVAIPVIAIALAMYIAVATALLGSPFSKSLKKRQDKENPKISMLGRLASYLKIAGISSILTIAISTIYILEPQIIMMQTAFGKHYHCLLHCLSAASFALYVFDLYLMILILLLLIVELLNAALPDNSD